MIVEVNDIGVKVRDISYKNQKKLQGHYKDVYRNGIDNVKQKDFNYLLGEVAEIAFKSPKDKMKPYSYEEELKILYEILLNYLELSEQSKKEKGE